VLDAELLDLLRRGVVALERIAGYLAPAIEEQRDRRPATLSKAAYTREERDRQEFRKTIGSKAAQPKG
jgi:hypothetical protein